MNNLKNNNKPIRIVIILMLFAIIMLIASIFIMDLDIEQFDTVEFHEICASCFILLIIIHIILFRKRLKNILFPKNK
ncbi:MAG: hypothetical protein A2X12_09995 [Bacteroidetes bacterium GWE2_29_8]|nr:MAG: hypothetical protein A2X12_09995 [Bacteroidetes bacterium GWE2_29_8]OFY20033.1 MAG: hypothetical protein A2X02_06620 [Bacteroidetes bacterium GWF2_29_10]